MSLKQHMPPDTGILAFDLLTNPKTNPFLKLN